MHARMMWNPSVNAIWLRAWVSSAASGEAQVHWSTLEPAAVPGSAARPSLQSISAASARSSIWARA